MSSKSVSELNEFPAFIGSVFGVAELPSLYFSNLDQLVRFKLSFKRTHLFLRLNETFILIMRISHRRPPATGHRSYDSFCVFFLYGFCVKELLAMPTSRYRFFVFVLPFLLTPSITIGTFEFGSREKHKGVHITRQQKKTRPPYITPVYWIITVVQWRPLNYVTQNSLPFIYFFLFPRARTCAGMLVHLLKALHESEPAEVCSILFIVSFCFFY